MELDPPEEEVLVYFEGGTRPGNITTTNQQEEEIQVEPSASDDQADSTEDPEKGTSWLGAVFLIVNAALGAGILNFPEAFHKAGGIEVAVLIQIVLLVFITTSLLLLSNCANKSNSKTYEIAVEASCGRYAYKVCSAAISLYCFGTCITFLIIIGDQFDRVFLSYFGDDFCHYWYMDRRLTISVCAILCILPLCFSKRIDFLTVPSLVGVVAVFFLVFVVIYEYFRGGYTPGEIRHSPKHWLDVFNILPVICFGYQCHISSVPIFSCLKPRSMRLFSRSVVVAIILCFVVYSVAASFAYLTFGSHVVGDLLELYDAESPVVMPAIIVLALKTITTYPILLFCGREAIVSICGLDTMIFRYGVIFHWFGASLLFAIFIPNITVVIQMLGSLAALFIFAFPGLILLLTTLDDDELLQTTRSKVMVVVSSLFLVVGSFLFGEVFTQGIMGTPGDDSPPVCVP